MGFYRQGQPAALDRAAVTAVVTRFLADEIGFANRTADPFEIDDPCPHNAGGPHQPHASCGDVVCIHCTKVFWQ